ncbi:MAG: transferrin-binding protein-like solute binding protein [Boseongicola sp. SB0670_bin_30]|nr:transferrin-binding protein-like solute binding protein [Boseongicola sp. SB0670_bin_30]
MRSLSACGLALAAILSLAACSETSSGTAPSPGDIREVTGLPVPAETAQAQQARQRDISSRADSLIRSTLHIETVSPDATRRFRLISDCSGTVCHATEPTTGVIDTSRIEPGEPELGDAVAIGSAHDITLMSESLIGTDKSITDFGAWMRHSAFALSTHREVSEELDFTSVSSNALGQLTGRPPAVSATWLGIMVGTLVAGEHEGDRLVGEAALNYDLDSGGLDAGFHGIKNIDRGVAHSDEPVFFVDLAVEPDGTFARGQSGTRIHGAFYGPGHVEAAGIFEHFDMVGAFGAKRQ